MVWILFTDENDETDDENETCLLWIPRFDLAN